MVDPVIALQFDTSLDDWAARVFFSDQHVCHTFF